MLSLVQFNLPVLLVALAIGVAAGRWMFAKAPSPPASTQEDERLS
jgi:hypothetical protein